MWMQLIYTTEAQKLLVQKLAYASMFILFFPFIQIMHAKIYKEYAYMTLMVPLFLEFDMISSLCT